jgi:hypothetical protein
VFFAAVLVEMSSASDTTLRRKQRALFADKIVQQEIFTKGWKNHIVLEGGSGTTGATTYPPYYDMVGGSFETTESELNAYKASVPNQSTVPGAPTNVSAVRGNSQATVSFTAPANNGGLPIASYTVTSSPGGFTASGSATTLTVTGLTNGTAYTFTVVATNALGNSPPSSASNSVTPATVPGAPTGVSAVGGNAQATVSFTPPASNGGSAITSYTVTSTPGGVTQSGPASPLTVTGLTNNTAYTFRVVAANDVGPSAASSASNSVTPAAPVAPGEPTLTYALTTDTGIYTYVTAAAAPAGVPTNYEYSTDGVNTTPLDPVDTVSPVLIPGLTTGTSYSIQLAATNDAGTSGLSNTLSATPSNTSIPSAWLNFDPSNASSYSGSGTTVNNVGSYGALSGTMTGSITVGTGTGLSRNVFNMNGGRIVFGNFDFGTDITITAWIRPQEKFSLNCIISNGPANSGTPGFKFSWNGWESANKRLGFETGNGSPNPPAPAPAINWLVPGSVADVVVLDEWQHVACVFKRDQRAAVMLRNGDPVDTAGTVTAVNVVMSGRPITIGAYEGGSFSMKGQLGSVKVFNSALTAYQVNQDFQSTKAAFGFNTITTFTTVGSTTWTAPAGVTSVDYLVVGGGGGGGGAYDVGGGGGGGGGLALTGTRSVIPGTTYNVTVGDGGTGGTGTGNGGGDTPGNNGSSSTFDTIVATGGGGGGGSLDYTGAGGAIGNAGTLTAPTGGKGGRLNLPTTRAGGGGGGMGNAGSSSPSPSGDNYGAAGGSGITNTLSGSSVVYSAGGNGGDRGSDYDGANGANNTGNGGGGAAAVSFDGSSGGKGGSGVVILSY